MAVPLRSLLFKALNDTVAAMDRRVAKPLGVRHKKRKKIKATKIKSKTILYR